MEQPLVSVCIGTYNKEKYIRETLESVFAQTYSSLEVVVVDDASTDGTIAILETYGNRIRLIRRPRNSGGCTVARNQAIRAATGRYIAILDADDLWGPEKIARQVAFMEFHSDLPMCHTYCRLIDRQSNVIGIRHQGLLPPTGPCFRPLLQHCYITLSSTLYRREIFDEVGLFEEGEIFNVWGETEFFLRIARRYDIGLVDEPLASYRKSDENTSLNQRDSWKHGPESVLMLELILQREYLWKGVVERKEIVQALVDAARKNCEFWSHRGHMGRAIYFLIRAQTHAPLDSSLLAGYVPALGRPILRRIRR